MDIEDQVIKALQSYDNTLISAIAEDLAQCVIRELKLKQEWAIALAFVNLDGSERVDDIYCDASNRQYVVDRMNSEHDLDCGLYGAEESGLRRYLVSRLYTGWEEEKDPEVDEDLAALVVEDAV